MQLVQSEIQESLVFIVFVQTHKTFPFVVVKRRTAVLSGEHGSFFVFFCVFVVSFYVTVGNKWAMKRK